MSIKSIGLPHSDCLSSLSAILLSSALRSGTNNYQEHPFYGKKNFVASQFNCKELALTLEFHSVESRIKDILTLFLQQKQPKQNYVYH